MLSPIEEKLLALMHQMSNACDKDFTGTGIVLYQNDEEIKKYHCNLVNQMPKIDAIELGTQKMAEYLLSISSYNHPCHDGFHFINHQGKLTHVAQFFAPPVNTMRANISGQGARTLCALHGSAIPGVNLIGTISLKSHIHLFKNGALLSTN